MSDYYIGIDYGTRKVAVAVIDAAFKLHALEDLQLTQSERFNELQFLCDFTHEVVAEFAHSAHAAIESAILGASMNAQTLANQNITSVFVASATWKKEAIGRGNATKDEVATWAAAVWPEAPIKTQDQADALGMAVYASQN